MRDGFFIINDGVLEKYTGREKFVFIPEGIREIGKDAFLWNSDIVEVEIPEGVTKIGDSAFDGCTRLSAVNIPSTVTEIGEAAFCYCTCLKGLTIEEGSRLSEIKHEAFLGCLKLPDLTLPESVARIGKSAFLTSGVRALTVTSRKISISTYAVDGDTAICATNLTPSAFPKGLKTSVLRGYFLLLMKGFPLSEELCERYGKYVFENRDIVKRLLAEVSREGRLLACITEYLLERNIPTSEDCDLLLGLLRDDAETLTRVMEYKKKHFGFDSSELLL